MIATGLRKRKKNKQNMKRSKATITTTQDGELPCAVDTPQGKQSLHGGSQQGEAELAQSGPYCEHSTGTRKS